MKNYKLIPRISLWVLMAIGIACIVLFFAGGSEIVQKKAYYKTGEKQKVEIKADGETEEIPAVAAESGVEEEDLSLQGTIEVPVYENEFLMCTYLLFGIAVLITICAAFVAFINNCKYNPRKAIMSVVVLVVFAGLFVVCWYLGSDKPLTIPGYKGSDNVPFWLQLSDMIIYACYFLITATICAMVGGYLYTKSLK